jgi:hypothetical protein
MQATLTRFASQGAKKTDEFAQEVAPLSVRWLCADGV